MRRMPAHQAECVNLEKALLSLIGGWAGAEPEAARRMVPRCAVTKKHHSKRHERSRGIHSRAIKRPQEASRGFKMQQVPSRGIKGHRGGPRCIERHQEP